MGKYSKMKNQLKDIYSHINSTGKNYESMSHIEKAMYAQQAFNNVNNYCSLKWNMKPQDTPFGYSVGVNCNGSANPVLNYVTINLGHVMGCKNPQAIYKTLFHEMGHIRQFNTRPLYHKFECKNSHIYRQKDGSQTAMQWKASPDEVTANHFAYKQLVKADRAMLKNPATRVHAIQNIKFLRTSMLKNVVEHIKGVAHITFVSPFQKLFGIKPHEKIVGNTAKQGPRILNLQEVREFFTNNPEAFKDPTLNKQDCTTLREFIVARNDEAHIPKIFFKEHRNYNTQQNNVALEQFNNGQQPQFLREKASSMPEKETPNVENVNSSSPETNATPPQSPTQTQPATQSTNMSTNLAQILSGILQARAVLPQQSSNQENTENIMPQETTSTTLSSEGSFTAVTASTTQATSAATSDLSAELTQ